MSAVDRSPSSGKVAPFYPAVANGSPNGALGEFLLALAHEDAERMTGRIGVDEQRLVWIVRTIKEELGP
ncbi:hypothetical protein GCM10027405_24920 [Arthrobacter alkaliphilus]